MTGRNGAFRGEPLAAAWLYGWGVGALTVGVLSYWSTWPEILLAPTFIAAGLLSAGAGWWRSRAAGTVGLAIMVVASWARAIALWGVDQHGAGSDYLASAVWFWVTLMVTIAMIAVARRGVEQ